MGIARTETIHKLLTTRADAHLVMVEPERSCPEPKPGGIADEKCRERYAASAQNVREKSRIYGGDCGADCERGFPTLESESS